MAKLKITSSDNGKNTWKATGVNPNTGNKFTVHGGQKGVKVGSNNPASEKTFDARHGKPKTVKQYINKLRWDDKAKIGSEVIVPNKYFS